MNKRFDVLDGLRGLAAFIVVLHHALTPWGLDKSITPHASLAVDFFFGLSGFVLAHAYEERLAKGLNLSNFVVNRLIRLYPAIALGIFMGVAVFIVRFRIQQTPEQLFPMLASAARNIIMLPSGDFLGNNDEAWPANPPQWSLMFELVASLTFATILWRLSTNRLLTIAAVSALASAFVYIERNGVHGGNDWSTWHLGFVRITYHFLAGMLLQRISKLQLDDQECSTFKSLVAGVALLIVLVAPVPLRLNGAYEVLCVLVINVAIIHYASGLSASKRCTPAIRWLGEISYPLYALHYPIVRATSGFTRRFADDKNITWQAAASILTVLLCIVVAQIALRFYDAPLRSLLTRKATKINASS